MTGNTVLIAGASGLVGAAAVEHFMSRPDWRVTALSRKRGALPAGVEHIAADLTRPTTIGAAAARFADFTHLIFAALYEKPDLVAGWRDPEQMQTNLAMLRNLLDVLAANAPRLRHITLLQGTKAYGSHVEPIRNPAKERAPRHPHENFYWLQEDLLRERQPRSGWTFTVLRPQIMLGHAVGSPMNIVAAIGAYAAIMREMGEPLCFPGGGPFINGATDARLLAQAMEFVATNPIAENETYNVVNGDVLVWQDFWGSIARQFAMPVGPARPLRMAEAAGGWEPTWQRIAAKHGLREPSLQRLVGSSWQFTDRAFGYGVERPGHTVLSTIKLRQAGFADCIDTEDSVLYWLERMQSQKLLPG